jgi:fructose-bisphosphate aldolase class II
MQTLHKILEQAEANAVAIGHFNISDLVTLKAVFEAARDLNAPVVVGTSEGERQFIGVRQVAAMVKSLREEYDFPIFLNADHTHSLLSAIEAAKAGFDWIVIILDHSPPYQGRVACGQSSVLVFEWEWCAIDKDLELA